MNKNDREFLVQKIRTQYTEKEHSGLDALKKLDQKVKRPANILAYLLGSIGAIILGCGMSFCMTDLAANLNFGGDPMIYGIVIGCIGLLIAILNYPLYKAVLGSRKKKYAAQILKLSDELTQQQIG